MHSDPLPTKDKVSVWWTLPDETPASLTKMQV